VTNITHPTSFKEGIRVLLLMLRAKDGGSAKTDRRATKKVITTSPEEFDEALTELRSILREGERIYSTVDPRDLQKAIRSFQFRMLEAQWFDEENRNNFYLDLENRWISCLKDPKSGSSQLFLFDIDDDNPHCDDIKADIDRPVSQWDIVDKYPTKNGIHIITTPFNYPRLLEPETVKCRHANALMLWSY
jgi:hypothetical protein